MTPALVLTPAAPALPCPSFICKPLGAVGGALVGSVIDEAAKAFADAEAKALTWVTSLWVKIPTPAVATPDLRGPTGPAAFIWNSTRWYVAFLAIAGLLFAAGRLIWERRAEPARAAAAGMVTLVVVTSVTAGVVELAAQAGDEYSNWIIDRAFGQQGFQHGLSVLAALDTSALGPGLVIILGILAAIACFVQIVLLLVRVAMLGLLVGVLPIAAAVSSTSDGRMWFKRALGWLIAFVVYKPVAATIYAAAYVAMMSESGVDQIAGIVMIVMAIVALPALMRFVTPVVASATGGGGGGAGVAAGALAAVAVGARMVPAAAPVGAAAGMAAAAPTGASAMASGAQNAIGSDGRPPGHGPGPSGGGSPGGGGDNGQTGPGGAAGTRGSPGPAAPGAQGAGAAGPQPAHHEAAGGASPAPGAK